MQKPEIVSGLKNALEHGHSIDEAKQSFVNAGYVAKDVEDSAGVLNFGAVLVPQQVIRPKMLKQQEQARETEERMQETREAEQGVKRLSDFQVKPEEKGVSKKTIIILSGVLVVLLSALAATFFL